MVGFICSSWPINNFSGMSAVGPVYSHPSMKRSSLNVNFTTTTHKLHTSAVVWQSCFRQLRCSLAVYGAEPLKRAYKLWCEAGNFIWIIFLKLLKENLQSVTQKNVYGNTPCLFIHYIDPHVPWAYYIVRGLIISAVVFRIQENGSIPLRWRCFIC